MSTEETCPYCGSDLRGDQIPEESLRKGYYGEWDGVTPQYFGRTIGVEIPGMYDGVLFYQCPDCDGKWHRWPEGHRLRDRARPFVEGTTT